jgi:hypothetical protein
MVNLGAQPLLVDITTMTGVTRDRASRYGGVGLVCDAEPRARIAPFTGGRGTNKNKF